MSVIFVASFSETYAKAVKRHSPALKQLQTGLKRSVVDDSLQPRTPLLG